MGKTTGLTRAQVEALRLMAAGAWHETTVSTRTRLNEPAYIGGMTIKSLRARGYVEHRYDKALSMLYKITDAGRDALAKYEERRR